MKRHTNLGWLTFNLMRNWLWKHVAPPRPFARAASVRRLVCAAMFLGAAPFAWATLNSGTAVSSSANPSVCGQVGVTFTATVTNSTTTPAAQPTGTVQFQTNGVNFGGAVILSGGSATSPALPSTLYAGVCTVSAVYSGDANYNLSSGALPPNYAVLHNFSDSGLDGANPAGTLLSAGGVLYGTSPYGGAGAGNVFSLNASGTGLTSLHDFTGPDGYWLGGGLALAGNTLFGTANLGGQGYGTVFALNTNGTGFSVLYEFTGGNDGGYPWGDLLLAGNKLYGSANSGGNAGYGTVFALNLDGTGFAVLHTFTNGADGANPAAGLIISGNTLYGTASGGGSAGAGTVFALNVDGTGFTTLHSFTNGSDGATPVASLLLSGNMLYGTASEGGSGGQGTVFAINTNGTAFATLHAFSATTYDFSTATYTNSDGASPSAGVQLAGGMLYGTAAAGGSGGQGTVFTLNLNGSAFTTFHSFTGGLDAGNPVTDITLVGGTLYGTASAEDGTGPGTLFAIALAGQQILPEIPMITWAIPASIPYGTPLSSEQLDASANVPGTFVYTPTAGTILTPSYQQRSLGVAFSPNASQTYATAFSSVAIAVNNADSGMSIVSSLNPATLGADVWFTATITNASVPGCTNTAYGTVQFQFDGSDIGSPVTLSGGNATLGVWFSQTGNYTVSASYAGFGYLNGCNGTLAGGEAIYLEIPTISWAKPASIIYGTPLSSAQLDATASVDGTFEYTPAAGALLPVGTNTLSVTFTPTYTYYYPVVTSSVSLIVMPVLAGTFTNSSFHLTFQGVANASYQVQVCTNLANLNWQAAGTVTADTNGIIEFVDPHATNSQRYYRFNQ